MFDVCAAIVLLDVFCIYHGQIICAVIDDFDFRQICCWGHQIWLFEILKFLNFAVRSCDNIFTTLHAYSIAQIIALNVR